MTIPDMVTKELSQIDLTEGDLVDKRLSRQYVEREYIVQYQETDHAFISRWMEHEGIFYFFEEGDAGEVLVLADSNSATQEIRGGFTLPYVPRGGLESDNRPCIRQLVGRQCRIPDKVTLKDYNYRVPKVKLEAESKQLGTGKGFVTAYGDHFKTVQEGKSLAQIRGEELVARQRLFNGESNCVRIRSGARYQLTDHYRADFDQEYLVTEVRHRGSQPLAEQNQLLTEEAAEPEYDNVFVSIPADVPFRPARVTPKPRLDGVINARIDAAASGEYAEIDDEGRYKLILPFDPSDNDGGRASRWVRMAQPYTGSGYGMHFPLHKDAEVIVTCVDGDPDRPIICGTVPNPENQSPVTGANQTQAKIRTGGGNQITMEDEGGNQRIKMETPFGNTRLQLGSPNDPEKGIYWGTDEDGTFHIGGQKKELVKGNVGITLQGDVVQFIGGFKNETIVGVKSQLIIGSEVKVNKINKTELTTGTYVNGKRAKEYSYTDSGRHILADKIEERCKTLKEQSDKSVKMAKAAENTYDKLVEKSKEHFREGGTWDDKAEKLSQQIDQMEIIAKKARTEAKKFEGQASSFWKTTVPNFVVNNILKVKK
jgi:type VI secretion system secreted protein VgrG